MVHQKTFFLRANSATFQFRHLLSIR